MPKEMLVLHRDVFGPESGAASALQVRWGRNGFVEIGARIVYAVDPFVDYVPTEAERPEAGGRPIDGLYATMQRHQINELIRHLRRARDQAFGRDE